MSYRYLCDFFLVAMFFLNLCRVINCKNSTLYRAPLLGHVVPLHVVWEREEGGRGGVAISMIAAAFSACGKDAWDIFPRRCGCQSWALNIRMKVH